MKTTVDQWELAGEIERLALKLAGAVEGADDRIVALTTRLEQWMKQAEDTEYHRLNAIRRAFDAESRLEQAEGALDDIACNQGPWLEPTAIYLRDRARSYFATAEPSKYVLGDLHECGIRHYAVAAYLDCEVAEPTKGEP